LGGRGKRMASWETLSQKIPEDLRCSLEVKSLPSTNKGMGFDTAGKEKKKVKMQPYQRLY
jgi:hypothetical protein